MGRLGSAKRDHPTTCSCVWQSLPTMLGGILLVHFICGNGTSSGTHIPGAAIHCGYLPFEIGHHRPRYAEIYAHPVNDRASIDLRVRRPVAPNASIQTATKESYPLCGGATTPYGAMTLTVNCVDVGWPVSGVAFTYTT